VALCEDVHYLSPISVEFKGVAFWLAWGFARNDILQVCLSSHQTADGSFSRCWRVFSKYVQL